MQETQQFLYILAAVAFILGIRLLGRPQSARWGNLLSAAGMLVAVVATLFSAGLALHWIFIGLLVGSALGAVMALRVAMTGMPEMVALLNGFGGLASLLVACAEVLRGALLTGISASSAAISVLIGGITFSGSLLAWGKLAEKLPGRPLLFRGQKPLNLALLVSTLTSGILWQSLGETAWAHNCFFLLIALSLLLGILFVLPIGGGDMPVVISLLNSLSGLAACAVGFVLMNRMLIVAGCLVGASGLILTEMMCKSMNRSLSSVLWGGFGAAQGTITPGGEVHSLNCEEAYYLLEAAAEVLIVPGYGMAVAQAQHAVQELAQLLSERGTTVNYAIHPVAGRMPGHMNVLLAEAHVPYEQLIEMETANRSMERVDICLVIGANDIVNPAALEDPGSAIYGMPIIEAQRARTAIVLKRSMGKGFAGIDNPLFFKTNARMLFGDAKASLQNILRIFKESEI
ncbi:NAD synthetase [bacterium (Candidatus Blackallbacteria) CG17_big_fil_post_rev_8_21_14_2_50_48_46]|uniref:NAD(P) transhydrogenase subunit beta n=1 Tax=bacterium (Candidatus Blackallbacteria) CG17_big_fil_post_rev_8_21_14_2_50_48_46 TaxID=2014261 RepID=A0A2M7FYP8_9BACT|nr:MAG: NAD synthetase [bacterium (Candidatus Blackallbacteria) CG18_big_fil_WC_8_21_14_2_50_49_26]PIW14477.1 MAG: NAD synthetase [bacterium (Candidatus Blackallbacteria) CG17_big_fil_post_rev_8_21_14_2_50_48_46]PIW47163.1 MAG: NAD synthetase [bacterium (Candidatus Blackallbacteria) CG13_big_fil_rev_8_21_14_2_50_49_14]